MTDAPLDSFLGELRQGSRVRFAQSPHGRKGRFSAEEILKIREACELGASFSELGRLVGVSAASIQRIHKREMYRWVEETS